MNSNVIANSLFRILNCLFRNLSLDKLPGVALEALYAFDGGDFSGDLVAVSDEIAADDGLDGGLTHGAHIAGFFEGFWFKSGHKAFAGGKDGFGEGAKLSDVDINLFGPFGIGFGPIVSGLWLVKTCFAGELTGF